MTMPFEDGAFQLVDLPPLCREHVEPWVYDLVRAADLAWLVAPADQALDGLDVVNALLGTKGTELHPAGTGAPGASRPGWVGKHALLIVTGMDQPGAIWTRCAS